MALDPAFAFTVFEPPPETDTAMVAGVQTLVFFPFTTLVAHVFARAEGILTDTRAVEPESFTEAATDGFVAVGTAGVAGVTVTLGTAGVATSGTAGTAGEAGALGVPGAAGVLGVAGALGTAGISGCGTNPVTRAYDHWDQCPTLSCTRTATLSRSTGIRIWLEYGRTGPGTAGSEATCIPAMPLAKSIADTLTVANCSNEFARMIPSILIADAKA
jgi:hypothetical protein